MVKGLLSIAVFPTALAFPTVHPPVFPTPWAHTLSIQVPFGETSPL
jgi:hypothetical protein